MHYTKRLVQDGTVSQSYADAEGITLIPEFNSELYRLPYKRERWNPLFPEKGVTITRHLGLNNEKKSLQDWFSVVHERATIDYYDVRIFREDQDFCDRDLKLLMGVLHSNAAHIAMAFKRLNGEAAPGQLYSEQSLLLIGAALWNTWWVPNIKTHQTDYCWRDFVDQENRVARLHRDRESRRQAAVADFLGDED